MVDAARRTTRPEGANDGTGLARRPAREPGNETGS